MDIIQPTCPHCGSTNVVRNPDGYECLNNDCPVIEHPLPQDTYNGDQDPSAGQD